MLCVQLFSKPGLPVTARFGVDALAEVTWATVLITVTFE